MLQKVCNTNSSTLYLLQCADQAISLNADRLDQQRAAPAASLSSSTLQWLLAKAQAALGEPHRQTTFGEVVTALAADSSWGGLGLSGGEVWALLASMGLASDQLLSARVVELALVANAGYFMAEDAEAEQLQLPPWTTLQAEEGAQGAPAQSTYCAGSTPAAGAAASAAQQARGQAHMPADDTSTGVPMDSWEPTSELKMPSMLLASPSDSSNGAPMPSPLVSGARSATTISRLSSAYTGAANSSHHHMGEAAAAAAAMQQSVLGAGAPATEPLSASEAAQGLAEAQQPVHNVRAAAAAILRSTAASPGSVVNYGGSATGRHSVLSELVAEREQQQPGTPRFTEQQQPGTPRCTEFTGSASGRSASVTPPPALLPKTRMWLLEQLAAAQHGSIKSAPWNVVKVEGGQAGQTPGVGAEEGWQLRSAPSHVVREQSALPGSDADRWGWGWGAGGCPVRFDVKVIPLADPSAQRHGSCKVPFATTTHVRQWYHQVPVVSYPNDIVHDAHMC